MNLKKLFTMVAVFVVLVASSTFAQSTFFVNNLTGNDANSGTTAGQAKATVNSAMIAAPAGSFISVAATGVNYIEAAPTVRGTYTFTSTGGTPVFSNALNVGVAGYTAGNPIVSIAAGANALVTMTGVTGVKNGDQIYIDGTGVATYDKKYFTVSSVDNVGFTFVINTTTGAGVGAVGAKVAARGDVTFQGPFQFAGINLNVGTLTGGDQVTITTANTVYRTELGFVSSGGLVYGAAVNVVYDNLYTATAVTITTGLEWPTAVVATNLNTANTSTGGITLKLDNTRTIEGVLTTVGAFNLNSFQFNINGDNAHTIGGAVTGTGPLNFTMLAAGASIGGAFPIPNVVATDDASGAYTLTINATITNVGSVTVNSKATAAINNNGTVGNITLNGSGNITTSCQIPGVTGTVTMAAASTGNVTLNNNAAGAYTTGAITNSGTGTLTWGANASSINVGTTGSSTNVLLNTAFTLNNTAVIANTGRLIFTDVPVTVWGSVTNSSSFTGSSNLPGNNGNGLIVFSNTVAPNHVIIKNTLTSNVTGSITVVAPGTATGNGLITFAGAVGASLNLTFAGVSNTSTLSEAVGTGNAYIKALLAGNNLVFTTMSNTSTYGGADIDFTTLVGTIGGTSISQSGSVLGGDIKLGNGSVTLTGDITNSRSIAGSDILIGTAASVASLGAKNINNSGKSNITFTSVSGAGTVNLGTGGISSSGTGTISFPNATGAGTFAFTPFTVSAGTVSFGNGTGNITVSGVVSLTAGTIDFGTAARLVTMSNAAIQFGGVATKPTFSNGGLTRLSFAQPIPNVNQIITLGTLDNTWPGYITVDNNAAIPAPYVFFKSIAGTDQTQPGLLYILNSGAGSANGLLFDNTLPAVTNFVQIDNARLNIGKNAPGGANGGGFQNTGGYTTVNGGFVMMSGGFGAAQPVNGAAVNAGATFGNFGVANNSGTSPCVTFGAAGAVMTGDFYLANGAVLPTNLDFTAAAPYSTIFRTEGTFTVVLPNPTSKVNVTYYGGDKTTSNEIPAGLTKLFNLTVATTNGAKPGFGIISMTGSFTVNGTLTINANQALYTAAQTLTIAGASAVINGYLVDDGNAAGRVALAAATGTTFTGSGFLPTLIVNNGSLGNSVTGYTGVYANGFGLDGVWGGAGGNLDDFTTADGSLLYQAGAGDTGSSLTVGFTGAGPHFGALTMGVAAVPTAGVETFTLSSNAVMSGNITIGSGTINLGDFTLTHQGTVFSMSGDGTIFAPAAIISTANGKLAFTTTGTVLNATVAPATIAANVDFNCPTGTIGLPAYGAGVTDNLTITGNVTLDDNAGGTSGTTVDVGLGNLLTLGGTSVTVSANSLFTATTGGTTGILDLTNSGANTLLTFTIPASASVANLTVDGNVTLAGGIVGSTLTVTNFIHNSGLFTFGSAALQIGNATAATFSRTGATATYSGDGYLIWNSTNAAGFAHSTVAAAGAMTINSLQLKTALTLQNGRNLNVIKNFYLNGGSLTNQVGGTGGGYLFLGDANNTPMVRVLEPNDVLVNALQFTSANADYTFNGPTASTITSRVWPATATLARNVIVNMAAAANTLTIPARTINGNLTLTAGVLTWDDPVVVTIGTGSTITRTNNGSLNKDASSSGAVGVLTAPNVNLVYTGAVGNTGIEYSDPVVVNNFTMGTTAAASTVTLNTAGTIAGTVTINNAASVLTVAQNTTFSAAQTISTGTIAVNATKTLTLGAAATLPTVSGNVTTNFPLTIAGGHTAGTLTVGDNFTVGAGAALAATSNLVFVGATNTSITVPGNTTIGALTLNKTANTNTVTLAGGNLTLSATMTFTMGDFVTGSNILNIFTPTVGAIGGVVLSNGMVGAGPNSMVIGNVGRALLYTGAIATSTEPRIMFPVGTGTQYRPAAISFNPAFGVPTNPNTTIVVSHVDSNPGGSQALPIKDGVATGIDISRYPAFYWNIYTAPNSVGPSTPFDLELTAGGFTDFDSPSNVRIIRRHGAVGDITNDWLLQGVNTAYDNEVSSVTGFTAINRGANAGLRSGGAVFTLGISSNISVKNAIAKQWLVIPQGAKLVSLANTFQGNIGTLSFKAQSSNPAVATAEIIGTSVKLTPLSIGEAVVTVTAVDAANNDFFAYSFSIDSRNTDVATTEEIPTEFALSQNFPNPFNPTTNIKFALPKESNVTLKIYNILGEEVANLVNKVMPAGYHTVNFDATRLASGMYIYRIEAGSFVQVKKMLLMK